MVSVQFPNTSQQSQFEARVPNVPDCCDNSNATSALEYAMSPAASSSSLLSSTPSSSSSSGGMNKKVIPHKRSSRNISYQQAFSMLSFASISPRPAPQPSRDDHLQSTNKRRRYQRRGSRVPSMLLLKLPKISLELSSDVMQLDSMRISVNRTATKEDIEEDIIESTTS